MTTRSAARTIYLLKRAETTVRLRLEDALRDLGVTPGQFALMAIVHGSHAASSAALARQVCVTPQSMSEMITTLERKGWLERGSTSTNRRILHIGLSAEGRALIRDCNDRVDRLESALFEVLTADQMAMLRELLERIGS